MKTPEFNKWFRMNGGIYDGWFIMVDDDTAGSTGGYYVYEVKDPNDKSSAGYDNWFENKNDLDRYFEKTDFELQSLAKK